MVSVILYPSFDFMCCSVNGSVCLVCCMPNSVYELFGETIRNMYGCGCYGIVQCGWRYSV